MRHFFLSLIVIYLILEVILYVKFYKPDVTSSLVEEIYEKSVQIRDSRYNKTKEFLNRARIKGASNSYVEPVYLNDKDHLVINKHTVKLENATILVLCRNWELKDILS